jgi:hypothetical protein
MFKPDAMRSSSAFHRAGWLSCTWLARKPIFRYAYVVRNTTARDDHDYVSMLQQFILSKYCNNAMHCVP